MAPDRSALDVSRRHGVPFVVIGGHAVDYHGHLRATEDTDVVWQRSIDSESRLLAALEELSAEWIGDELDPTTGIERTWPITASFVRDRSLTMLRTRAGYLDLFDHVPGIENARVEDLFDDAGAVDGIRYVSLVWLRRLEAAAGRPRDLLDLENLPAAE